MTFTLTVDNFMAERDYNRNIKYNNNNNKYDSDTNPQVTSSFSPWGGGGGNTFRQRVPLLTKSSLPPAEMT